MQSHRYSPTESCLRECLALKLRRTKLGPDHPLTLTSMNNPVALFSSMRRLDRSIPLFDELLPMRRRKLGDDHPSTSLTVANLGVSYRDAVRLAEAIPLLDQAYRQGRKHASLAWVANALVSAYVQAGETDEATALIQDELASARERLQPTSPQLAGVLAMTGKQLLDLKSYPDSSPTSWYCHPAAIKSACPSAFRSADAMARVPIPCKSACWVSSPWFKRIATDCPVATAASNLPFVSKSAAVAVSGPRTGIGWLAETSFPLKEPTI